MAIRISGLGPAPGSDTGLTSFGPFAPGTKLKSLVAAVSYTVAPGYAGMVIGISSDKITAASGLVNCTEFLTDRSEPSVTVGPACVLPHGGANQFDFWMDLPLDYVMANGGYLTIYMEVTTMLSNVSACLAVSYDDPEVVESERQKVRAVLASAPGKVPAAKLDARAPHVVDRPAVPNPTQSRPASSPAPAPVPKFSSAGPASKSAGPGSKRGNCKC